MKYKKYLSIAFIAVLLLPLINGNTYVKAFNNKKETGVINAEEMQSNIDLGFETKKYLPTNFDPYTFEVKSIHHVNFMVEDEVIDLGFDTQKYLPHNFDAFAKQRH